MVEALLARILNSLFLTLLLKLNLGKRSDLVPFGLWCVLNVLGLVDGHYVWEARLRKRGYHELRCINLSVDRFRLILQQDLISRIFSFILLLFSIANFICTIILSNVRI